jgi:hypothetical protein
MAGVIVRKILECIDESEKPRVLRNNDIKNHTAEELEQLLKRGILTREVFSSTAAAYTVFHDDGEREEKFDQSPPEPFYTIVVPRIFEAIREDNALKGQLRDFKGRLFELGEKSSSGLPPIKVCLSLRNQDTDWFDSICERVVGRPDQPALLLVPRWIPVSEANIEQYKLRGLLIRILNDCLMNESWKLPWDKVRPEFGSVSAARTKRSIPAESFPTPSGTNWRDITIYFKNGHTVSIRVKGQTKVRNYSQMGMINKKNGNPTLQWELLRTFAEGHGILDWGSRGADRKNQKRKETLAKNLQDFFGISEDPFELTPGRKGWKARFKILPD